MSSNCRLRGPRRSSDVARDVDVFGGGQGGQQIVLLEHEPHAVLAQLGALGVGHAQQVAAGDVNTSRSRRRQAAQDVKQGGLAGAAGSHDRHELALGHREIDASQRVHLDFAGVKDFLEAVNLNHKERRFNHKKELRWRPAWRP